jgi:hypothetical protein
MKTLFIIYLIGMVLAYLRKTAYLNSVNRVNPMMTVYKQRVEILIITTLCSVVVLPDLFYNFFTDKDDNVLFELRLKK